MAAAENTSFESLDLDMPKARVRFTAIAGRQARELFSAEEDTKGNLYIFQKREAALRPSRDAPAQTLLDFRISVHPSLNANGTTIKQHERTDQDYQTPTSFIHNSGENLLWPLFARHCPNLELDRYLLEAASEDTCICVCNDAPRLSSLTYVAFVARTGNSFPAADPYACYAHEFKVFSICLYAAYINLPPIGDAGYASYISSKAPLKPGEQRTVHGFENVRPEAVGYTCHTLLNAAAQPILRWYFSTFPEGTEERKILNRHPIYWTTAPIERSNIMEWQGDPALSLGLPTPLLSPPPRSKSQGSFQSED